MNQKTIEIVQSTVPVLEQHGEAITTRFYELLFENHPELLNVFNQANQANKHQQKALAHMVYMAAKHITELETLMPAVKTVAHKHRSIGIKPEQYPIVGENLLAAIKDVLGDAATDEIIDAWAEAYGEIANVFIQVEDSMRDDVKKAGGWEGYMPFKVAEKKKESDVITSFYLIPTDERTLPVFESGQYISVKSEIEGRTHIRQYSLSDAPGNPYYRISVKRESEPTTPEGKLSNYLHDHINEGDLIDVSAPAGDFTLVRESRPVVFISGGIGQTPLLSMAKSLLAAPIDIPVTWIHAARDSKVHAFKEEIKDLDAKYNNFDVNLVYSELDENDTDLYAEKGFIDEDRIRRWCDPEAEVYFCGPAGFMAHIETLLKSLGVPENRQHFEFFGPKQNLETVQAK